MKFRGKKQIHSSKVKEMAKNRAKKRNVVLIPYYYQGHMTPMLQLGKILHSNGFSVIVAHPEFNSPNPSNHPEFIFLPLEVDLSGLDTGKDILGVMAAINHNCKAPLVDYLVPMIKDQEKYGQICCIIYDIIMNFGNSVADHLKIPSLVLTTCSAFFMQTYRTLVRLGAENQIPLQDEKILEPVPGLHALRYKDLVTTKNVKIKDKTMEFFAAMTNIRSSVGIIWNSAEVLDRFALADFEQHYKVPSFPIGPFHRMSCTNSSTSYIEEDRNCIAWLNKQAPHSVLYISLGSLAVMEKEELEETAWGLAKSGVPFLWVIRPGAVIGSNWIELLPEGFQDVVGERGYILKWAPQKEVLAHSSVGGFLSHCGWNSTLESICEGVPMICRPHFADQLANTRYITHVWKVGLELERATNRDVIERTIKRVMMEDEGSEIRQKMAELKQSLEGSMQKNGSSYNSLNDLTEFICSFPRINS